MKNIKVLILSAIYSAVMTFGHEAIANPPIALPLASEKLGKPIQLSGCPGLRVVEWRASQEWSYTSQSDDGVKVMEKACQTTLVRYPEFLRSKKLEFKQESFSVDMALIPANTIGDGKGSRNMNDVNGRFQIVQPNCCSWGIYDSQLSFLFLRNDPISIRGGMSVTNKYFVRTFVHELGHVLNHKWHVKERYFPNNPSEDEKLVEEWVSYLGITFATESSSEDWMMKKRSQ